MTQARIRVRGQVQGVGFRPFVWTLARRLGLRGRVRNDAEGVLIEAAGAQVPQFLEALRADIPPLARIDSLEVSVLETDDLPLEFVIMASTAGAARTRVTPDAATCPACLAEIRDPGARRFGYAFANCTHCGPRFSILRSLPYDRGQTTMAAFVFCAECAGEYGDPADRRFHAQPIACPACGPRLWFERAGSEIAGDAIALAAEALRAGEILAIKGLGGFHLACDAQSEAAVALLRARKHRPDKPFALMGGMKMIAQQCMLTAQEEARLQDAAAPILLLARRPDAGVLAPSVAPGQACLGWMLPYTPLHHLVLDAFGGPLVMTSGNLSGEPQVICNAKAREALAAFADGFVMHDRDIARRLDDSVERMTAFGPMVLRHARGRAPSTLRLPPGFDAGPQVLAMGGQMKGAFCLTRGNEALLSHHLGDLDDALSWSETRRALADYAELFDHTPAVVAVDLHEGFRTTQHGRAMALPVQGVQHHHAHMSACMGDNMWPLDGPQVAAIVLDGLGLGLDGTLWGGELLLGDYAGFDRLAWLDPAPLPGGDAAGRAPWRNALMRLDAAGLGGFADQIFAGQPRALLRQAVAAGINAPLSSSAGRVFDAVAATLGLSPLHQSFEGQAAMALEALAGQVPRAQMRPYPTGEGAAIGVGPLFEALVRDIGQGVAHEVIAARFHAGLAQAFATRARALIDAGTAKAVVLSGGCFQNAVLLGYVMDALGDVRVLVHARTPVNDGSLAYGQALVALARHRDRGRAGDG